MIAESNSVPTTDGTQNVLLVFDVHNIVHAVVPILLQTPAYVSASCPGPTKMAPQNPVGFKTKKNMKIDTEHRNRYLFPDIKKKKHGFFLFFWWKLDRKSAHIQPAIDKTSSNGAAAITIVGIPASTPKPWSWGNLEIHGNPRHFRAFS